MCGIIGIIGKNDISLQRNASINSRISLPYLYGLDPHEPFSFANNIMNIKKDDVHSVIDKYLHRMVQTDTKNTHFTLF